MVPDRIEREIVIAAPVERVWELVTQAEHLGSWFCDAGAEVDLRPGGTLVLSWEEHGTARCRIERVEPNSLFSFRWALKGHDEPVEGYSTLVEFTFAPEGDGTRVRVVETGFASVAVDEQDARRQYEDNTEGWRIQLDRLAEYAARVAA